MMKSYTPKKELSKRIEIAIKDYKTEIIKKLQDVLPIVSRESIQELEREQEEYQDFLEGLNNDLGQFLK